MDCLISECVMACSNGQRFDCGDTYKQDFWELLPTPPRSPDRPCSDDDMDLLSFLPTDIALGLMSEPLDTLDLTDWDDCATPTVGLKNDLLHDCMWSGMCTHTCRRGHDSQKQELTAVTSSTKSPTEIPDLRLKFEPQETTANVQLVDPCVVLPYTPLSDHSYHNQNEMTTVRQPKTPPVCDTPSDTEDEIDVVTLPTTVALTSCKPEVVNVETCEVTTTVKRRPGRPRTVPPLRVVIRTSNVAKVEHKHRKGHHHHSHNRKKFQKRFGGIKNNGGWTRRHYKRHFTPHRTESCSSDSEDCVEKRTMHNSMERKRRDDLRFAFQTLRQNVPDLASNPKAPKVLILNRAASYARQLSQTGAALEKTLKQETRRRQELQRKLMQLSKMK